MYDIIGDIHGHADELTRLLDLLGYGQSHGVFSHPSRKIVFVGDFIDRGPKIWEVLQIVRPMIEEGEAYAVMGNHEFNAISYHTRYPQSSNQYARIHSEKNVKQHAETVRQVPPDKLAECVEWFRTLPMSLALDDIRVVHATWDPGQISLLSQARPVENELTDEFVVAGNTEGTSLFSAIDDVLKGKEVKLPEGYCFRDKDGHERKKMRTKWYEPANGKTYASYALSSDDGFPELPLTKEAQAGAVPYPADDPPVFFGHYWLRAEQAERLAVNVACVDYSVAKGGMLCAYRWDGERELSNANFVTVG